MDLPEDIATAFSRAGILERFRSLPPGHQHEYVRWIDEAKHADTRGIRIGKSVELIRRKTSTT